MNKVFADTTILTDILLKPGPARISAKSALNKFQSSLLPAYAIKEFKAGPLRRFVWFHNKLVLSRSFEKTLAALQKLAATPQRYLTLTAIEALRVSAYSSAKTKLKDLEAKYGPMAEMDQVQLDEYRLATSTAVLKAWARRRQVTDQIVSNLNCYEETAPRWSKGLLDILPVSCSPNPECCLGQTLKAATDELRQLKEATNRQPPSTETARRSSALGDLIRKPKMAMSDRMCRNLGDAFIVFLAPRDAVILTTNVRHLKPLADALDKIVKTPEQCNSPASDSSV